MATRLPNTLEAVTDGRTDVSLQAGETLDAVCGGEVLLIQRKGGYRFSVDALLLAAFAGSPRGKAVDLGTGCGVIPLVLASRGAKHVVGVELQAPLYNIASRNAQLNQCAERVQFVHADLRHLVGVLPGAAFDLVTANPPYVPQGSGNLNPEPEKALARHELTCSLPELAAAARYLLREGGSFKLVFPSARLGELMGVLTAQGLQPRRMRVVYTVPCRPARLVLLEAAKGRGVSLDIEPPLYLFDETGSYTPECARILKDASATLDRPRPAV